MNEKETDKTESIESEAPEKVAIEGKLPLTAIDIESQKDMESGRYHKIQSLHKWFAARPTPAVRLAILASVYGGEIKSDELLRLMQIGPKALEENIAEYVEEKFSSSRSSGTIDDHYAFPNPNTQSPSAAEKKRLHQTLKKDWGGELPSIIDPTAGRGVIPFEALRYGLPVKANELNPVAALILKTAVKYAPEVGSVTPEIWQWRDRIQEEATKEIDEYYPTEETGRKILNSACTYLIQCKSCEGKIPIIKNWWLNKTPDGGDAVRPKYEDGNVYYEHVNIPKDVSKQEYNPNDAPLTRRSAECPHCGVVTEQDDIERKLRDGDFDYSVYGVNYETQTGEKYYRGGSDTDKKGMEKAIERVESDFELMTFLTEPIEVSSRINDPTNYGMEEWRDIFTPRQLVVHYEYLQAYNDTKPDIIDEYNNKKADTILTILAFLASRAVDLNTRLTTWYDNEGTGARMFSENNYSLKRKFTDNNLTQDRRGYHKISKHVIESYEALASYEPEPRAEVTCMDAACLTDVWDSESADAAIVDPPYYSSIMYSELSDIFYSVQKEYLNDVHPELFSSKLTDKDNEAVANPSRFEDIAEGEKSKKELAREFYEEKMQEVFEEIYDLLSDRGIMTVMFTHRDMDAWDTLTTALINSGFTITATHPIKTEMSDRISMRTNASADSSILLIGRKKAKSNQSSPTLWEDIESEIGDVAKNEAINILESGYTISKTDTAIAAYGPTLQRFADELPVVDKKGNEVRPRQALAEARKAVTSVLAERYVDTEGIDELDSLTRWYILSWLIYENNTLPYDEGRQLGVAAGVDIEDIKRPTKIWSKSGGDMRIKSPEGRVQDIILLRDESVEDPSSRKYPVDPTDSRFTYTIDTVHAAVHVYEREGAKSAWDWLTERNLKSDSVFEVAVTALLEVLPEDESMHRTLVNLVSGETGDYLDINVDHIDMSGVDRQTSLGDHKE